MSISQFSIADTKSPGIIVLGGHVQSLGILRIMGRLGIKGTIIDSTSFNLSRHSRYCQEFFMVSDDTILDFLLDLGKSKKYQGWLIFPSNDYYVKILSQNKTALEEYYIITTDQWESIKLFYNKRLSYKLASELNIPIPNTYFPDNEKDLFSYKFEFPCIIKPAVMHSFYKKVRSKVYKCANEHELLENYRKALKVIPADQIIIQEIVKGPSKNQFSACYLFLNGIVYVYLTACRMRQHPIDFGNATTYAETVDVPIIREYSETILKKANFNGICEVEYKLDERDNVYKFLEVNTRLWKWHAISNKSNSPFLKLYYDYLTGKIINPVKGFDKASFCHFITDFPTRMKLFCMGYDYWNRKVSPVENAVMNYDDLKPSIFEILYLVYFFKKR